MNPTLTHVRESLGARRTARRQRAQLARELGAYSTESERQDLSAMLDRHPDEETRHLRGLLADTAA